MLRLLKSIVGILLLPACIGSVRALFEVIAATGRADTVWVAFLAGAVCWCLVYFMLPKPMWVYVFGHELTHAIWAWIFGGRVRRFKVTSKGGHVVLTRSNFLISLAPYFFPLYAVVVVLFFAVLRIVFDVRGLHVWFHLLLGAAYAFHLTLTIHVLRSRQSDIADNGHLFSWVVIFLGNVWVMLLGVPLLTGQLRMIDAVIMASKETTQVLHQIRAWIPNL